MIFMLALSVGLVIADEAVKIDETANDTQIHWYTGTWGQQIAVDANGKVHAAYCKTFFNASDSGYQVYYQNITDGKILAIPSQEPTDVVQQGIAYIDGGHGAAPMWILTGVGGRMYGYGPAMHLQAFSKVSNDGNSIESLGLQQDAMYYADPHYSIPVEFEVDYVNGYAHVICTNPSGWEFAYWNFDGTNFGEIFNLCVPYPDSNVPGKNFPGQYHKNATKGLDIAVSPDGSEVTVASLHPYENIFLHKGTLGGELWSDNWWAGMADGSIVALFDTTNQKLGVNIPENDPKPYTAVQVSYDDAGNLHVVYDATYESVWFDTTSKVPDGWWWTYGNICGDTLGTFYDGTTHPKPQLRYWNSVSAAHTKIADCDYPMLGETYKWWNYGVWDSSAAGWGDHYNDGLIANMDLVANKSAATGEPLLVVVWEEMQGEVQNLVDNDWSIQHNYMAYFKDVKASVMMDMSSGWSTPVNLTKTANRDEGFVSVFRDVIDNNIHMLYFEDGFPGADRWLAYMNDYQGDELTTWSTGQGEFAIQMRKEGTELVNVMYRKVSISELTAIESDKNNVPGSFSLEQNYPNPFNPTTTINYTVPAGKVSLEVYDILGKKVATLVNQNQVAGSYSAIWNGKNAAGATVASGVYLYKLQSEAGVKTMKMMFQK